MPVLYLGRNVNHISRVHDEQFAAGCVVLTTLLSIVTLPLCALVLTALM